MPLCFRITVAGSLLLALTVAAPAQTATKTDAKAAEPWKFATEVSLLDCDGVPCIEARIGEGKLLKWAIDTGNVSSVVDKGVADAVGLKPTKALPAGAPAGMFITAIPAVHIGGVAGAAAGGVTLHEVPALGLSLGEMIGQKQLPDVAGSLSYTAFKDRVLQIDFVAHKVRISELLARPVDCAGVCDKFSFITFGKKGPPIVVAQGFEIDGQPVSAQVDTMFTGTMLVYTAAIDKLGLTAAAKTEKTENLPFTDGGVDMRTAPANKESFHGAALGVSAPVVYFPTPDVHEPDGMFDATVGLGLFYGAVLTLNFHDMTISVTKP
jgi:predicted aspartyl protease